ncbi:PREDICTED: uncharacterized protein LOC108663246 [Theobroma cacao]|uniref:Uncharacterized protein LOC108663246 n=1 Tax=Theobroma cacao TaxID=3641 RepID=A0AB32WWZ4_THECC|nr:PREDICTED: uncharacterized protein LOC108663246 [Theobroma cacao]
MVPYEALYWHKCRSPISWFKVGEWRLLEPEMVQEAIDRIRLSRDRMLTAQRQNSYVDHKHQDLEFEVGDLVFFRVLPTKGIMRLVGKCFTCLYYANPKPNPTHVIWHEEIQLEDDLSYEEIQVKILDRKVKLLCTKDLALVKVLWCNHSSEEVT